MDHIIGKKSLVSLVWAAFKILRSVFKITGKTCVTRKSWFKILQKQESEVADGTYHVKLSRKIIFQDMFKISLDFVILYLSFPKMKY